MNPQIPDLPVLIVGCGSIGRRHGRVLSSLGMKTIDICDPSSDQRSAMRSEVAVRREYADFSLALAAKPFAVFLCTPSSLHIPQAVQALRSGAHVLCEKPLSDSLAGIDELEKAIQDSGRRFMVAFCFRYHEGLSLAKSLVDEGRIGRLVSARFRMSENLAEVRPDYKTLFTLKEGGVFDLTHEIDLAFWFCGTELTHVHTMHAVASDLGFTAPDIASVSMEFEDRKIAQIYLDFFSVPRTRLTELMGTEGTITVEFASWDSCTVSVYEKAKKAWERIILPTERDAMFRREDEHFLSASLANTEVDIPFSEGLKSLKILAGR
jgi:predicted dehydrogenase